MIYSSCENFIILKGTTALDDIKLINSQLLDEAQKIMKVLSNPTRIQMLNILEQQELTVNQIVELLNLE